MGKIANRWGKITPINGLKSNLKIKDFSEDGSDF